MSEASIEPPLARRNFSVSVSREADGSIRVIVGAYGTNVVSSNGRELDACINGDTIFTGLHGIGALILRDLSDHEFPGVADDIMDVYASRPDVIPAHSETAEAPAPTPEAS